MYTTSHFEPFDFLINSLLEDSSLLPFEPVIAGGFAAALFLELKQIESADAWQKLTQKISKQHFNALSAHFGDIDFYFLGDSPIWQSEHRWLISDYLPSKCARAADNPFGFIKPQPDYYSAWGASYVKTPVENALPRREIQYQLMRNPFFSAEECIESFDLITSCIAWHQGNLVFNELFEEAFDKKEVAANAPGFERIRQSDIYTHLFTCLRAFKYCRRFNFTLSEELQDFCAEVHAQLHLLNLGSDTPLCNQSGEITANPVPCSAPFRRVYDRFLQAYTEAK